jgi:hypothetical protein
MAEKENKNEVENELRMNNFETEPDAIIQNHVQFAAELGRKFDPP